MDKNTKNGVDIRDKAYYARCIRQLKEWGAPLDGWRCTKVIDVKEDGYEIGCFDDLFECELCGCTKRYEWAASVPESWRAISSEPRSARGR